MRDICLDSAFRVEAGCIWFRAGGPGQLPVYKHLRMVFKRLEYLSCIYRASGPYSMALHLALVLLEATHYRCAQVSMDHSLGFRSEYRVFMSTSDVCKDILPQAHAILQR